MSQKQISYEKKLQLIELVRQRPALWNVQDPLFTDNPFKANVWKEVSSELGEDLEGESIFWIYKIL